MGKFLDYRNVGGTCAVAICDRCRMKKYRGELKEDPDNRSLLVCSDCADLTDPYKLPPRAPDNTRVDNPRPDVELT